ncbi:MAG: PaaI family thioesterase [Streptosporangiaceae bacterium]
MPANLDDLIDLMPLARDLGIVLDQASPDLVVARLAWSPRLCTAGGILHGGALMTLADTTGALVAYLGLPSGATTATMTSTTHLLRPVRTGTVRADAVPLHRGRAVVMVQTTVTDADGHLVAQVTQTQAVRPPG